MEAQPDSQQAILARLDNLERQTVRPQQQAGRWRLLGLLGCVVGSLGLFTAPAISEEKEKVLDEVSAPRFSLVDQQGNLRGGLSVDENGLPFQFMVDSKDNLVSSWSATGDGGAALIFYGPNKKARIRITAAEGTPVIGLFDTNGKERGARGCRDRVPLGRGRGEVRVTARVSVTATPTAEQLLVRQA